MAYMDEAAAERERIRNQMLGGYTPREIGSIDPKNPQIQAQVRKPTLTSPGIEALMAALSQSLAPRKVKVDEMRDLQVPIALGGRVGSDSPGWRDSGVGGAFDLGGLKGLKNKLEAAKAEQPVKSDGKASVRDAAVRGRHGAEPPPAPPKEPIPGPYGQPMPPPGTTVTGPEDYGGGTGGGVAGGVPGLPGGPSGRALTKEERKAAAGVTTSEGTATGGRVLPGVDLKGVDPRIAEIVHAAAEALPEGYKVRATSGVRTAGHGQHTKNAAIDFEIVKPDGTTIKNRGDDTTGMYTKLARAAYGYQEKHHPDLTGEFHWGGQFGTSKDNPNEPDLMHFGFGKRRGRIAKYSRESIGAELPPVASTASATPPATGGGGGGAVSAGAGQPMPDERTLSDKSIPAGNRFNNPMNMWHDGYATVHGGVPGRQITPYDTPAIFPSKLAGATAIIQKMAQSPLYSGKTMDEMIKQWVNHGESYAPWIEQHTGISKHTKITPEFLASEQGLKFLKAMARYETKSQEEYPLSDAEWRKARDTALHNPPALGNSIDSRPAARAANLPPPTATAAAPSQQEVKVAGPPMAAPQAPAAPPPAAPVAAPPPPKPPVDPYAKARKAHDFLDSKVGPLVQKHAPEYADKVKSFGFADKTVRDALQHPMAGSFVRSQLTPHLAKMGIDAAELDKAITSPRPPPPPKAPPPPAPEVAKTPPPIPAAPAPAAPAPPAPAAPAPAAPAAPPAAPAAPVGEPTSVAKTPPILQPQRPVTPGPEVPPPSSTEITVRQAPGGVEPGSTPGAPAAEGARGGETGTAAKVEVPVEAVPDAAEVVKPEGAGAGDSTVLPAIEVEEGATAEPAGFYGAPPGTPLPDIPPGELNARWNERIYEATDRPTMARDERLGPDPHPSFNEFRKSANVDDRRFDPQLTPEQQTKFKAQSGAPKGQFTYTSAEHKAAQAQAKTPLAEALGSKQIENLEATVDARRMAQQSALAKGEIEMPTKIAEVPLRPSPNIEDRRAIPLTDAERKALPPAKLRYTPEELRAADAAAETPLAKQLGSEDIKKLEEAKATQVVNADGEVITEPTKAGEVPPATSDPAVQPSAEASAAEVAQAGPAPTPTPLQTRAPVVTPEIAKAAVEAVKPERAPVMKPQVDAQPVVPATQVAPPQPGAPGGPLSLAPPGLAAINPAGGAMPGAPGSQGGGIAMLGLAPMPVNNAVFSTPLLDATAQQPQAGAGTLAPFPWQETAGWGWGGGIGSSLGGGFGDFGGGSDFGGGLGSGLGFFGSSFGG